jgi:hypothetical protein
MHNSCFLSRYVTLNRSKCACISTRKERCLVFIFVLDITRYNVQFNGPRCASHWLRFKYPTFSQKIDKRLEHKRHYWILVKHLGFKWKSCNFKFNNLLLVSFTCFNNAPTLFFKTLCRQHYACTCTLCAARHSYLWFIWLPNRSVILCILCKELACVFNSHAYEAI